ncbi:hypothetical protein BDF20DRAFT_917885 [Mycotypha africana]|uniref:uncharacterized protein n=1 Tax=Mycotypha africana TaxID=64632 RepID=UPI002301961D|nr:uncharacterized protein BDF20DRAFT_917885 [Mycotypha africana]KAI8967081.1 hypothetical protein BDF20DRAFT_917885 [Mycotypha africana]
MFIHPIHPKSACQNIQQLYFNWKFDFKTNTDFMPGTYEANVKQISNDFTESCAPHSHQQEENKAQSKRQRKQKQQKKHRTNHHPCKDQPALTLIEPQYKGCSNGRKESEKEKDTRTIAKNDELASFLIQSKLLKKCNKTVDTQITTHNDDTVVETLDLKNKSTQSPRQKQQQRCATLTSMSVYSTVQSNHRMTATTATSCLPSSSSWADIVKNNHDKSAQIDNRKQSVSTEASSFSEVPSLTDNESMTGSMDEPSPQLLAHEPPLSSYGFSTAAATTKAMNTTHSSKFYSPFSSGLDLTASLVRTATTVPYEQKPSSSHFSRTHSYLIRPTQYIPSVNDIIDYTPTPTPSLCSHQQKSVLDSLYHPASEYSKKDCLFTHRPFHQNFSYSQHKDITHLQLMHNVRNTQDNDDRANRREI